ncbi:MAG: MBL fold metallo-hydrolase [Gemmatimonadota bacterium]|nr:MBL fold metallo-hydrolase [Gemmatimonadota bacterium]MDH5283340.1 MBL fold metallo-hydrolase [Gemmatimonadota bacterium]
MPDLAVVSLPNGRFSENCYLLADQECGRAVMVDPGEEPILFLSELDRRGWQLEAVWLTHAHVDHIMGVRAVKQATGVPVLLHPADRSLYDALPRQGEWMGLRLEAAPPPDVMLSDGQQLILGSRTFTVRHTPGHSPGSVSFVTDGRVFGGDVLFSGSIGRTDLPGGDYATLLHSIQTVFLALPDSTIVHSGHGPDTTVGIERVTNPFLVGASRLG